MTFEVTINTKLGTDAWKKRMGHNRMPSETGTKGPASGWTSGEQHQVDGALGGNRVWGEALRLPCTGGVWPQMLSVLSLHSSRERKGKISVPAWQP
jgi:hypothetical protein